MSGEPEPAVERAYRYRVGWVAMGSALLFLGMVGAGGRTVFLVGCERVRNGQEATGVALMAVGVLTAPAALLAVLLVFIAVRAAVFPERLRVTPTALHLPSSLRGSAPKSGEAAPAQPEEIPFATIRWVRREPGRTPTGVRLMVVHDLSPSTLVIKAFMMRPADFEELEAVLRAAVPAAFAPTPPPQPS